MGMTIDEKIELDLKHCSFNGVKYSDYVKEHYISKDQYESRLKADMIAILTDIQLEIEEMSGLCTEIHGDEWNEINTVHSQDVLSLIQQKIDKLRGEESV